MRSVKPARGIRGQIICEKDGVFFRVIEDNQPVDYKITHLNLNVQITDDDAAFYDREYLDHAPDTIGVRIK